MRSVLSLLAALLAIYVAWVLLLFVMQRSVIFPGAGMPAGTVRLPSGAVPVSMPAAFGDVEAIWIATADAAPSPALLYFHGNAEFAWQNAALLAPLAAQGLHVLLVEYPGYAGAAGRPRRDTLAEAARVAHDWLAAHPQVDADRIIAVGRSIGSGPAVELARERPVAALVLLSPFASLAELARGVGAPAFLLRDRWDNRAVLAQVDRPLLVFHGRDDDIIPYRHALALIDVSADAELITLDCRHNDCPYFDAGFNAQLSDFLRRNGVLPAE